VKQPRTKYTMRRARKTYQCSEQSYHCIKPGDVYLYGCLAPEHEMNRTRQSDGRRWEYIRACLRCANEYGMHNTETRKRLAELTDQDRYIAELHRLIMSLGDKLLIVAEHLSRLAERKDRRIVDTANRAV